MRKEVTNAVRERIQVIKNRVQEIKSNTPEENELEYMDLVQEFWNINTEYNLFDTTFSEGDKMGVVDIMGDVVVPALYKDYSELYNYALTRSLPVPASDFNGKFALVSSDGKGTPLCAFEYDMINYMRGSDCFFVCEKCLDGKVLMGVLNGKGEEIVPCEMDIVHSVSNNMAAFAKDGKIGVLTMNGEFFPPIYDDAEDDCGFLIVCKDGVWGYLSVKGELIGLDDFGRLNSEEVIMLLDV